MKKFCFSIFLFATSCSQHEPYKLPLQYLKYHNETVSTHVALELAATSYIRGCVNASNKLFSYTECVKKGRSHIEDEVIFILEQTPEITITKP